MRPSMLGLALPITLLALAGCDPASDTEVDIDSDGDGLLDSEEAELGSDPNSADSDGDGLSDYEEVNMGTDPTQVDSDGDGFNDYDEVVGGADPTDPTVGLYIGGWPTQSGSTKDSITDPGWSRSGLQEGEVMWRFQGVDQFGDVVDLYDFAYQGKPVVMDLSGAWCYYCNEMAKMIEGRSSFFDAYSNTYPWVDGLNEWIERGDVYWITILDADLSYRPATAETVSDWYATYPMDAIPVLADESGSDMASYINVYGYPSLWLLNEDMTVELYDRTNYVAVLDELAARFAN